MKESRIRYIDVASGIMVIWMMLYHAINSHCAINNIDAHATQLFPFLHFFMPWFFYKSGWFFHVSTEVSIQDRYASYKQSYLKKDLHKLIKNYVIWGCVGLLLFAIFLLLQNDFTAYNFGHKIHEDVIKTGTLPVNNPIWFLLTLFIVRFIAALIFPNKNDKIYYRKCLCIIIVGLLCAYMWRKIQNYANYDIFPVWIATIFSGLSFFCAGFCLHEYENKPLIIIVCGVIYVISVFFKISMVGMLWNHTIFGFYTLWFPIAICGIIFFNAICRCISSYIEKYQLTSIFDKMPIYYVGTNAMTFYLAHMLIVRVVRFYIETYNPISGKYDIWMNIVGYCILLPFLCFVIKKIQSYETTHSKDF